MPRFAPIAVAALLAGCGDASDKAPAPEPSWAVEAPPEVPVMGEERRVLAFGDSLLTGYGLENGENYPAMLEAALRARGINARVTNAGVSGDTTRGGLDRLAFTLDSRDPPPELVLISLGGNDMLRALSPEQTRANLDAILTELDRRGIAAVLLGMRAAPNLGRQYTQRFDAIYPALAKKHGVTLVPFFLEPILGQSDLIQADHVHPTALGLEQMVAATVDDVAGALANK